MANNLTTHKEVQGLIWSALKWVLGVGLALAFSSGVWASTLRADVNRALEAVSTNAIIVRKVDSLSIEMSHITESQKEIKQLLLKGRQ